MSWLHCPDVPDWITETPHVAYELVTFSADDLLKEERIQMTVEEMEQIKIHLATLRGYKVTETEEESAEETTSAPSVNRAVGTRRETLVIGSAIAATYFGYDIGDHAGVDVDYDELLLKDSNGDLITSLKEAEEVGGGPVNVIVYEKTDKETAVRLLRKIADVIEKNGICRDEYAIHTKNPAVDQLEALRARVIALGGRVTGGEAVMLPE